MKKSLLRDVFHEKKVVVGLDRTRDLRLRTYFSGNEALPVSRTDKVVTKS